MRFPFRFSFAAVLALTVGLPACSVPDVRPFASATDLVGATIAGTADVMTAQVDAAQLGESNDALKQRSRQSWELRKQSAHSMRHFSAVLLDLAESGASGSEVGERLADSLGGLAKSFGLADDATIQDASGKAVPIFGLIAEVRATRGLRDSLQRSAPVVRGIRDIWFADLDDAAGLSLALRGLAQAELGQELSHWVARHDTELEGLEAAYNAYLDSGNADSERNAVQQQLATFQATLPGYEAFQSQQAALVSEFAASAAVIAATQSAVLAWSDTFDALVAESESAAEFSLSNLLSAVQRMRALADQFTI